MKLFPVRILAATAAWFATILPGTAEPKRLELGFPNLQDRIQIVFPENYDPAKKWPAVFYYHGTNGKPSTDLIRAHTNDQDWFVIGMSYVQRGSFTYSEKSLEDEWRILHSTRNHLATKWNLDRKRVYAAGFSKGGWMSGFMLQKDSDLAGAIILGAGHIHSIHQTPRKFPRTKPLFIGVGRQDGNYPFSLRALTFYRPLGARTTLEVWHDLEHNFPSGGSPGLRQWLALEANPSANHKAAAAKWSEEELAKTRTIPNPVNQWVALRDLEGAPYTRVLGEPWKSKLAGKIAELEKISRVGLEAQALAEHRLLLRKEMGKHTQELYEGLLGAYLKLQQKYANTHQGEIALKDHERVQRLLQHFEEQDKIAKEKGPRKDVPLVPAKDPFVPEAPKRTPVIPRNPLIR